MGAFSLAVAIGGLVVAVLWRNSEIAAAMWTVGISLFMVGGLAALLWFLQLGKRPPGT
jgi:hypothetical protein